MARIVGWHLVDDIPCEYPECQDHATVIVDDGYDGSDVCDAHIPANSTDEIAKVFARIR